MPRSPKLWPNFGSRERSFDAQGFILRKRFLRGRPKRRRCETIAALSFQSPQNKLFYKPGTAFPQVET
jgi:hypothetical protein